MTGQQPPATLIESPTFSPVHFAMTRLNPRQQEAVNYVDGPLLVLADAGSGNTSVITRKIAHLVQNCGIQARQNQWGRINGGQSY